MNSVQEATKVNIPAVKSPGRACGMMTETGGGSADVTRAQLFAEVLTGERASAFDLFGPACEQAWRSAAFSTAASDCELVVDSADDTLWARGAGCLVIREAVGATAAPSRTAAR
jgi:hypothetical protein